MKTLLLFIISLMSINAFAQFDTVQLRSINEVFLTEDENKISKEIKNFKFFLTSKNIPVDFSKILFSIQKNSRSILSRIYHQENESLATCNTELSIRHIAFSKKVINDEELKFVVWHELAHCLFNVEHNFRDVESIMFPYKHPVKFKKSQKEREADFFEEIRASQFNILYDFNLHSLMYNKYENIVLVNLIKVRKNQTRLEQEDFEIALATLAISKINPKKIRAQDHRPIVKFMELSKRIK